MNDMEKHLSKPDVLSELYAYYSRTIKQAGNRYTDCLSESAFRQAVSKIDLTALMKTLHRTFKASVNDKNYPAQNQDDNQALMLRLKLIREEFAEVEEAIVEKHSAEALLKELVDLVVVTIGTAVTFGWDFTGAFLEVHDSQFSKLGDDGKPIFRDDGKFLKGPNYVPPNMKPYL